MLLSLPVEIQRQCINYLDTAALKSTRLTSGALKDIATEALFQVATIEFTRESQEKFTALVLNNELRRCIRQINLNTQYDSECTEEECFLKPPPSWWEDACSVWATVELPNLKKLMLDTEYACVNEHCSALGLAFTNFLLSTTIETITVKHFQDACEMQCPESFQTVAKPKKLHLLITTWCDDASYDHELELNSRHTFFNVYLSKKWLEPVHRQLTHLSLHCNTYWGIYPQWQPGSLHFPHLQSMSFAQWTLFYDWQVEFITSHGQTLEQLILVNCPIIYALSMTPRQSNNLWQQALGGTGRGKTPTTVTYSDLRWHTVLPELATGLPKLKHFSMGRGPAREFRWGNAPFDSDEGFENRYELVSEIDSSRYVLFDTHSGITEWIDPIYERGLQRSWLVREIGKNVNTKIEYPDCLQEDQDALEKMLKIVNR